MRIENYKGIEFVRISAMPEDQQALIRATFDRSKIIKILRDTEVLHDCIQASEFQQWLNTATSNDTLQERPASRPVLSDLRLVFK
jgi:hypothetical protein